MDKGALGLWSQSFDYMDNHYLIKLLCSAGLITASFMPINSEAMDLQTAIETALRTNPEIGEAAANRRAIDFEYQQAKELGRPSVTLEGRFGPELVESRTTRILGTDDEFLFGRQASLTMQQSLYSFGRHDAEQDRQASRIDAAAHRVWERTEFVSLDVIQTYFDILRLREILDNSDQNVAFHERKASDLSRGVSSGVTRETDAAQARERLSSALVSRNEIEESHDIATAKFIQLVGTDIGQTTTPASLSNLVPNTLEGALAEARRNNPTIKIAYADLDVALSEYRAAKSENKPELFLEVGGRTGDHISGFKDTSHDVRAQVVFRYEFRGGIKKSAEQEHLNWADEQRQRVMTIERNVENLVRQAWITRIKTQAKVQDLQKQVTEGELLRTNYEREFGLGNRTLLDILDSQSSLFQAQSSLITATHADRYAQYRLLAATGQLLDGFGLKPRREAKANMRDLENVPSTLPAEIGKRKNPRHYEKSIELPDWSSKEGLRVADTSLKVIPSDGSILADAQTISVRPVERVTYTAAPITTTVMEAATIKAPSTAQPVFFEPAQKNSLLAESTMVQAKSVHEISEGLKTTLPMRDQILVEPQIVEAMNATSNSLETDKVAELSPQGMMIKKVSAKTYDMISQDSNTIAYPAMEAIILDNTIYLLSE